jgi:hypothetical protein
MKNHLTWLAAAAAALGLCAGAAAQSRNDSVDCLREGVSASGTSAAPGTAAASKRTKTAASWRAQQLARDRGTLPVAFPQCANKSDRTARAECVSAAWERRQSALVASSSGRRPC